MNKRVFIILLAIILVVVICILFINSKNNQILDNQESGEMIIQESSGEEKEEVDPYKDLRELNVPDKYMAIIDNLIKDGIVNLDEIKTKDELTTMYGLDEIGEYEGILIENNNKDDYKEIALIDPKDTSNNESLLLKMIVRYEKIKSENADSDYIRDANNVSIKQQGGMSIFILSNNNEIIYERINDWMKNPYGTSNSGEIVN